MVKEKKQKSAKAIEPKFTVTLGYNAQEFVIKGDSLEKIFLDYDPGIFKSLINLKVTSGKQEITRLWPIIKARRVFRNHNNAAIEASLLEKLFV